MIQRLSAQNLAFKANTASVRDGYTSLIEKNKNTVNLENEKVMNMTQKQSNNARIPMQGATEAVGSKLNVIA